LYVKVIKKCLRVRSFWSYFLECFCGNEPEMLNHVTLIGKATDAGPKLLYSDNGQPECRWTLAIEEPGAQGKMFTTFPEQ
jgi:hypothetical protein